MQRGRKEKPMFSGQLCWTEIHMSGERWDLGRSGERRTGQDIPEQVE
jgi:hypothetical protein